jgi:hypothetical protein
MWNYIIKANPKDSEKTYLSATSPITNPTQTVARDDLDLLKEKRPTNSLSYGTASGHYLHLK